MLGHRELTMEDYVGILKRRYWLILVSAIALLVGNGPTAPVTVSGEAAEELPAFELVPTNTAL